METVRDFSGTRVETSERFPRGDAATAPLASHPPRCTVAVDADRAGGGAGGRARASALQTMMEY